MGGLIETVGNILEKEMDRIAREIEADMKAEASAHRRTGAAADAIHIDDISTGSVFGIGRFIGAYADFDSKGDGNGGTHLYYLDQGNGGSGRTIYPRRKWDRRGRPYPAKLRLKDGTYRTSVKGYEGIGFIKKIADRYR